VGRIFRGLCGGLAALVLSSCSPVDDFSGRAVNFNLVAEQAQQQAVLLNIVRASLNRPMQFTTLSSITGTASESLNSTLSIPFGEATHRPKTGVSPDVFGLSGTVSGGPTFTVPVLDTQEFYQGELKPLTGQEYRFFLDEGITPSVLFYMFVDTIELTVAGTKPPVTYTFHSYVADDFDNDRYETVADFLLALGLSVEEVHRSQTVGPAITPAQLRDLRDIAQLTNAGLHITLERSERKSEASEDTAPAKSTKKKPEAAAKTPTHYQIEKNMTIYRPCFAPPSHATATATIDASLDCGYNDEDDTSDQQQSGNLTRSGGFMSADLAARLEKVRTDYIAKLQASGQTEIIPQIKALPPLPSDKKLQVRLYMRSPEAILHFLGSVVARYLHPTYGLARVIRVKVGEPYMAYPVDPCAFAGDPRAPSNSAPGFRCDNLFVVAAGQISGDSALSVDYDGKTYWIPDNSEINGRTTRMLDLIKQILALHTSAKELPASNVLNIIGGPTQ
jgi:hypothetical protein